MHKARTLRLVAFSLLTSSAVYAAPPTEQKKASWLYVADYSIASRVVRINPEDPTDYDVVASGLGAPTGLALVGGRLLVCQSKLGKISWLNPYLGTLEDVLDMPCYSLHAVPSKKVVYVADGLPVVKDGSGTITSQGSITRIDFGLARPLVHGGSDTERMSRG